MDMVEYGVKATVPADSTFRTAIQRLHLQHPGLRRLDRELADGTALAAWRAHDRPRDGQPVAGRVGACTVRRAP